MNFRSTKNQVNVSINTGLKVIPSRAFRSTRPCLLVTLNPIPVIQRTDYVMYLVRMKKAYEIFPKEQHDYIDQIAYRWRKIADDWEELMEIFEDVNHPVRGERLKMKTRLELMEETLNQQEKEALKIELQARDDVDLEEYNKSIKEIIASDNNIPTPEELSQDPFVQQNPFAKHYVDILCGKDVPDKTKSDLENEEEMEIEDFYRKWKESLAHKN
jgi:hypothetical protein